MLVNINSFDERTEKVTNAFFYFIKKEDHSFIWPSTQV